MQWQLCSGPKLRSIRREQWNLSEAFGSFCRLISFSLSCCCFRVRTTSPEGSQARIISAMLFRNIQASSSQGAVALIFARVVQASAEACCCCAVLRKLIVARRLRHRIFGLQYRQSICSAVHVKVGRLFPLLRSLVGLSLFYSPVFTTEDHTAFFCRKS